MLADEQRRVRSVGTPAHRPVKKLLLRKARQVRRDGLADRDLGRIGVGVCGVLCMGAWNRYLLRSIRTVGLVLLVPGEAGELVADLDDAVLIGFEEEADVAVVDYGDSLVLGGFLGRQLHMGIYPSLPLCQYRNGTFWFRLLTFEQHCSSRSTNVGLQAPAASTTLSA